MKIVKGLAILCFFTIIFGSCFDPPQFPIVPEIEYEDVWFRDVADSGLPDSLILFIRFKDGDGDLGIEKTQTDSPYHAVNYFLEDGTGNLTPLSTSERYSNLPPFINAKGKSGKLVSVRTRKKPAYSSLPPYITPFTCIAYDYDSIYVSDEDKHIFDNTYNIFDTLKSPTQPSVYILLDTFYYETNNNHYNIEVDFLVLDPGNPNADSEGYVEYDWKKNFCLTFDGRFPFLADKSGALEGTLRYSMNSVGFNSIFSIKTLKLRVQIKDRGLHLSNVIYTPPFKLEKIRR